MAGPIRRDLTLISADDLYLFNEGTHFRLWQVLGAHPGPAPDGAEGCHFAVWAPGAGSVAVAGDFNGWDRGARVESPGDRMRDPRWTW